MARARVTLYRNNVAKLLKNQFGAEVNVLAHAIAAEVGEDAEVSEYTTDREAASVRVPAHRQARDGALTRAAAALGLEIKAKP
ncbi:hypothetical protein [Nocardia brasiliensis]|uniref:hypothetical protein n=1 Tax=Nocardia brasiliensis TaxID=37326 RepID=UPI002453889A|nr:hypothetical protein [Nocardia brasiliensis]